MELTFSHKHIKQNKIKQQQQQKNACRMNHTEYILNVGRCCTYKKGRKPPHNFIEQKEAGEGERRGKKGTRTGPALLRGAVKEESNTHTGRPSDWQGEQLGCRGYLKPWEKVQQMVQEEQSR